MAASTAFITGASRRSASTLGKPLRTPLIRRVRETDADTFDRGGELPKRLTSQNGRGHLQLARIGPHAQADRHVGIETHPEFTQAAAHNSTPTRSPPLRASSSASKARPTPPWHPSARARAAFAPSWVSRLLSCTRRIGNRRQSLDRGPIRLPSHKRRAPPTSSAARARAPGAGGIVSSTGNCVYSKTFV